jgi:putative RecB family exonuclease
LHAAVEFFYKVPYPQPPSLDELLSQLKKTWRSEGYTSKSEEEAHFNHALQVLTIFYQDNIANFQLPLALEHAFELKLDGYTLAGKIDKVDRLRAGGLEITDFKTNRRLPALEKLQDDLQLSIYHLAAKEIWGIEAEKLTFYFLLPNQKMTTSRSREQIEDALRQIQEVAGGISAQRFDPRENPLCPWCDYQEKCPLLRHKYSRDNAAPETKEIVQTINEYAALKKQERELTQKISLLQEEIHSYCERHELSRLYGEGVAVSRIAKEKYNYDCARVKEILEPELWERIVRIDVALLKELTEKGEVDEKTKEALEAVRKLEKVSYALYLKEVRDQGND